jgi:hypothetical protein
MSNRAVPLTGLPEYWMTGQEERVEELNERIFDRFHPDRPLEPNFSPRGVPTKYALFPIVERRTPAQVPIESRPNYQIGTNFNPGTSAPVSGYVANIDQETILRNEAFALQRGAGQNVYVPSSQSDLYKVSVVSRPSVQPYPRLWEQYKFDPKININVANYPEIGADRFFNHTRFQLRGVDGCNGQNPN